MKRFLFVTAALLAMSVSFCFGQSKEDIKASIDRCAKLEKGKFSIEVQKIEGFQAL